MDKVRRFVDIQRQMQRAAEWALHDLRQEEHRLQMAQQEAVAALNGENELNIWLAPALTRRLGRLATEAEAAAAAGEQQVDVVLRQAGRLKHAERLQRALDREDERAREKTGLSDVVDAIVGRRGAIVR